MELKGRPLVQWVRPVRFQPPMKSVGEAVDLLPMSLPRPKGKRANGVDIDGIAHIVVRGAAIAFGVVDVDDLAGISAEASGRGASSLRVRAEIERLGEGVIGIELQPCSCC